MPRMIACDIGDIVSVDRRFAPPSNLEQTKIMKADPILQEVWDIKDRLAAEAGYDVDRFVDQLNEWIAKHPPRRPSGPQRRGIAATHRRKGTPARGTVGAHA